MTTTVGTDSMFRTTIDANHKLTQDFAVRANILYDQHDVAGRDYVESERWGGLLSATARINDLLRVTLDWYRYRNDAIPDWGVPLQNRSNVPMTEFGFSRNNWVGMLGLDFFKEEADIGTATVVAKLHEGVTLTNKSRVGMTHVDYIATSMEGSPDVHHPQRDQKANFYANQTELGSTSTPGTSSTTWSPASRSRGRRSIADHSDHVTTMTRVRFAPSRPTLMRTPIPSWPRMVFTTPLSTLSAPT